MRLKALAAVAVLALIAVACGPEEEQAVTVGPFPFEFQGDPGDRAGCGYSNHYIWLLEGTAQDVVTILEDEEGVDAEVGFLDPDNLEGGPGEPPPFDSVLDIVTYDGSQDARELVQRLRDEHEIPAGLDHAIGMVSHFQFKPGTDPIEATLDDKDFSPRTTGPWIAVVDTGIDEDTRIGWMFDEIAGPSNGDSVRFDVTTGDSHKDFGASHGTFIASLLRQLAPGHRVLFASAPAAPVSQFRFFGSAVFEGSHLTDEFYVAKALESLINQSAELADPIDALNLSWGTYPCELAPSDLEDVSALGVAVSTWKATVGQEIFAAAGNEPPIHGPFIPASLPGVTGVAAAYPEGDPIVWDDGQVVDGSGLWWADWVAPGCGLIGVGGSQSTDTIQSRDVAWGGSSFATAVASAFAVSGEKLERQPQIDLSQC